MKVAMDTTDRDFQGKGTRNIRLPQQQL